MVHIGLKCKQIKKNKNMKQILSLALALLPCLAWAQYPSNGNQKITLGEQTTADGLVFRGYATTDTVAATSKITRSNKQDTSAFLLLDTTTNLLWHYKIGSNAWTQAGGSTFDTTTLNLTTRFANKLNISDTASMLTPYIERGDTASMLTPYWRAGRFSGTLPVANGGTGSATQNFVDLTNTQTVAGAKTFSGLGTFTNATSNNQLTVNGTGAIKSGINFANGGTTYGQIYFDNNYPYNMSVLQQYTTGSLILGTNNNANLTIANGGNVGIGTTSPLALLNVMGTVRINSASAPDANYYLQLENSSSQKAKANAWDTYSDSRIKTNRQPIINAIDKINLLNPTYYNQHDSYVEDDLLNIDYNNSYKSLGFIAQEVYEVIPEAVNMGTTNELWAMDYTKLIPILTKAIQEQQALIKALEQRIINLINK
jgi:uncharacterized protein YqkB